MTASRFGCGPFVVLLLSVALLSGLAPGGTTPAAAAAAVDRTSYHLNAEYRVTIALDWAAGTLDVTTDMEADNRSGGPISRLELNTLAGSLGNMRLLEARVNGAPVTPVVSDQTIVVRLRHVLARGGHVSVRTRYRASLRHTVSGHDWLWTQSGGVASVYRSIPWLSRRTSSARNNIGDPFVTPVASLVRVTFKSTRPLTFATSGKKVGTSTAGVTYLARNVRDFNFAASPQYNRLSGKTLDGRTDLRVLTRWASPAQARAMLASAQRAIAQYTRWLGQLACPTVMIAESAGGSAMESPCLIWIPRNGGSVLDYLVSHELGHQWFYGVVGNDQAADPFLDEAVTDFLARTHLHQLRKTRCAMARLDGSIYDYAGTCYYETIYIQGSNFLNQLRRDIGSRVFWRTLRTFWADNRYTVSSTFKLLEAFRAAAGDRLLRRFHKRFPSLYP